MANYKLTAIKETAKFNLKIYWMNLIDAVKAKDHDRKWLALARIEETLTFFQLAYEIKSNIIHRIWCNAFDLVMGKKTINQ